MIPWTVTAAALTLGALLDFRIRRIPSWLPVAPVIVVVWFADLAAPWPAVAVALMGIFLVALAAAYVAGVGFGDLAFLLPMALVLGPWLFVALAVALLAGWWMLIRRQRTDDPFIPCLLAGFLVASLGLWGWGG